MSLFGDQIDISVSGYFVNDNFPITFTPSSATNVTIDRGTEFSTSGYDSILFGNYGVDLDIEDQTLTLSLSDPSFLSPTLTINLTDLDPFGIPEGVITRVTETSRPDDAFTSSLTVTADAAYSDEIQLNITPAEQGTYTFNIVMECFLTGTHILTDRGEVPVEALAIGDWVQTADSGLQPIKWIGKQTLNDPTLLLNPLRVHPILVKAGALGNDLPHRNLYVSPDHALLVDGLLINAGALVNGVSIVKTTPTAGFTYYHIELDHHSLLVVEGTYAESYLPQKEDRSSYDNGDEYEALYPHHSILSYWPMKYPRVSSKRQLPRFVSKKLMTITA